MGSNWQVESVAMGDWICGWNESWTFPSEDLVAVADAEAKSALGCCFLPMMTMRRKGLVDVVLERNRFQHSSYQKRVLDADVACPLAVETTYFVDERQLGREG